MPNRKVHIKAGAITGGLAAGGRSLHLEIQKQSTFLNYNIDWGKVLIDTLLGTGVGCIGGALPDILEPATSPFHRDFFHSQSVGGAVVYGIHQMEQGSLNIPDELKPVAWAAGASYLSHLALDGQTPMGLPIV